MRIITCKIRSLSNPFIFTSRLHVMPLFSIFRLSILPLEFYIKTPNWLFLKDFGIFSEFLRTLYYYRSKRVFSRKYIVTFNDRFAVILSFLTSLFKEFQNEFCQNAQMHGKVLVQALSGFTLHNPNIVVFTVLQIAC